MSRRADTLWLIRVCLLIGFTAYLFVSITGKGTV